MKAFSLLELLFALLIFSIMSLTTIHFSKELLSKNRAKTYTDGLRAALSFTRINAIKSGEKVTFCGSKNHKSCDGSWEDGQIVVTTSNKVLRISPKIFVGDRLIWHGSFGEKERIDFLPTGFPNGQNGSFHYCPKNNKDNALAVILLSTGRIRVAEKTAGGKTISCDKNLSPSEIDS